VALGLDYGSDYLFFAPWAYGILGQPTLTGGWSGSLKTHSGVQYVIYLQLNRDRTSRGIGLNTRGQADIDGQISWCAHGIPSTTSTLFGTANRSASVVRFEAGELRNPPPGLFPIHFQGAWHGSTLVLHVRFYLYQNHGYVYSTAIPDEVRSVRLPLHKRDYSVYQAACARI
jgi:hypothetical protein